jgi:TPR repeat protein
LPCLLSLSLGLGLAGFPLPGRAVDVVAVDKVDFRVGDFDEALDVRVIVDDTLTMKPKGLLGAGSHWVSEAGTYSKLRRATILGRDYALLPIDVVKNNGRLRQDGITNCRGEAFGHVAVDVRTSAILDRGIWLFPDCPRRGDDAWVMYQVIEPVASGHVSATTLDDRLQATLATVPAQAAEADRQRQGRAASHGIDPLRSPLPYSADPAAPLMGHPLWTAPIAAVAKAADGGVADARFILASRLVRSRDEAEHQRGATQLEALATEGDRRALTTLALANGRELGYFGNREAARSWLERAVAAGDPVAMVRLGGLYREGLGVAKSPGTAVEWWQQAAALGDPDAMRWLGWAYLTGTGVKRDEVLACRRYLAEAAKHDIPRARYLFADCLRTGTGVKKDLSLAFSLAYGANGPDVFQRDRDYLLGRIQYEVASNGGVTAVDALGFLQSAARLHNVDAMYLLAKLRLDRKLPGTFDLADGTHWLEMAAQNGHPEALKLLGKDALPDALHGKGSQH